jgi:hypothetical protein
MHDEHVKKFEQICTDLYNEIHREQVAGAHMMFGIKRRLKHGKFRIRSIQLLTPMQVTGGQCEKR